VLLLVWLFRKGERKMIKIALLFASMIFTYNSNWGMITEEIIVQAEIIWSDGITSLIKEDEENYLIENRSGWKYDLNDITNPHIVRYLDNLGIIYFQGTELYFLELNQNGMVVNHTLVIRDAMIEINQFFTDDGDFYILGSIANYDHTIISYCQELALKDIMIIKITADHQIFTYALGGAKDEVGLGLIIDGDRSFLFFRKDPLSGGDFAYSGIGNNVLGIAVLDAQMRIINDIAINDVVHFQSYCLYDNMLCLMIDHQLCYFSDSLESIHKVHLNDTFCYTQMGKNGLLLLISSEKIRLFDLGKMEIIGETQNKDYYEGMFLYTNRGILYLHQNKVWLLDFYWDEERLTTLYGLAEMVEEKYDPAYNPQIYGKYQQTTRYQSKVGIEFSLVKEIEVPLEVNIINGGIYPINYKLLFTGKAYIDGNEILNNYALNEEKEVRLDLVGANGEINTFCFFISCKQIAFVEDMHNGADFEVYASQAYKLIYEVTGIQAIEKLFIDGQETTDFVYYQSTNKLIINLVAPHTYGNHQLTINKVTYRNLDHTDTHDLSFTYIVKVIREAPLIELTNINTTMSVSFQDPDKTIRYFEITLMNQDKEEIVSYPIADSEILLPWLALDQEYQAMVNLVYDVGSLHYQRQKLLDFTFIAQANNTPIGHITINRFGDSLEKFSFAFTDSFNKTSLITAKMGDKIIFQKNNNNNHNLLLWSIGVMIISTGVGYGFRKIKHTKN
jgi:hypothetical protein